MVFGRGVGDVVRIERGCGFDEAIGPFYAAANLALADDLDHASVVKLCEMAIKTGLGNVPKSVLEFEWCGGSSGERLHNSEPNRMEEKIPSNHEVVFVLANDNIPMNENGTPTERHMQ